MKLSWVCTAVFAALCAGLCAAPAAAQVAVAVVYPLDDPSLRDSAAGVVAEVVRTWEPTAAPLGESEVADCKDDTACVLGLARARQASHVVVVGVGTLGRVRVVTARLFDRDGTKLYDEVYTTPPGLPGVDDGKLVGQRLVKTSGPPPRTSPLPQLNTKSGLSVVSLIGAGVIGASVVGAAAVGIVAATELLAVDEATGDLRVVQDREAGENLAYGAAVIGGLGLTMGVTLIAVDAFLE